MKGRKFQQFLLSGVVFIAFLPAIAMAGAVEDDVRDFLQNKDPKLIAEQPDTFEEVYKKHAPVIKESTLATVIYYFSASDDATFEDIAVLAKQAVTAAVVTARSDGDEGDIVGYITDAVCGSFRGGIHAAYKQATSAGKAVEGGLQAAIDAGVDPDFAATAVTRGIDTCLQERLDNDVILAIGRIVGNYQAPYQAYLPPTLLSGDIDPRRPPADFIGPDTDICVSNCI